MPPPVRAARLQNLSRQKTAAKSSLEPIERPKKARKLVAWGCNDDIDEAERECDGGDLSKHEPGGSRKGKTDEKEEDTEGRAGCEPAGTAVSDEGGNGRFVFLGTSAKDEMTTDGEAFEAEFDSHQKFLLAEREREASTGSEPKPPALPTVKGSSSTTEATEHGDKASTDPLSYALANAPRLAEQQGKRCTRRSKGKARARLDVEAQRLNAKKQNARRSLDKKHAKALKKSRATPSHCFPPPSCSAPKKDRVAEGRATPTVCLAVQEWWRRKRKGHDEELERAKRAKTYRLVGKTTVEDAAKLGVT